MEQIVEEMSGRSIYMNLDIHSAYNQRKLAVESRDLTMFTSLLGLLLIFL